MSKEEYANYYYQTTTVPLKTEYGVTIGTETKSTYKLCTNDCIYKNNWNELKKYIDNRFKAIQFDYDEEIIDKFELVVRENELLKLKNILKQMQELENRKV